MHGSFFIKQYSDNGFDLHEAKSEIDLALDILFNYSAKDYILGKKLTEEQMSKLQAVIEERLKTKRPLQQILGQAYFYNRRFFVDENTLIPRPETEILVSETIKRAKEYNNPKILDIGSGTGCIPVTLALENPDINADSVDISDGAIEIAKKNAKKHKVSDKILFFKSDLFENVKEKYDIIISNPPYIPLKDKDSLQTEVKDFEPELALFTKDDAGIEIYQKIINFAPKFLNDNGIIGFEMGINQAELIKNLLEKKGFKNIKIIKDLNNIERIIFAEK